MVILSRQSSIFKFLGSVFLLSINLLNPVLSFSQKEIAITIDDVQMDHFFFQPNYSTALLDTIQQYHVPVAILISEGRLFKDDSKKRFYNIEKWIANPLVTVGSHSFSHLHFSDTTYDAYKADIEKGLNISLPLVKKYNKSLQYFRFPFNDLGADSSQHVQIKNYLTKRKLTITPFSVESEDYAYAYLYEYYLYKNDSIKARQIAKRYLSHTLALLDFFETATNYLYKKQIKHIYLCHDNLLNQHYFGILLQLIGAKGYHFITLEKAMQDPIYTERDSYYKKWGLSWIYRLNMDKIKTLPVSEPDDRIEQEYNDLIRAIEHSNK